jgi:hypothetical protein
MWQPAQHPHVCVCPCWQHSHILNRINLCSASSRTSIANRLSELVAEPQVHMMHTDGSVRPICSTCDGADGVRGVADESDDAAAPGPLGVDVARPGAVLDDGLRVRGTQHGQKIRRHPRQHRQRALLKVKMRPQQTASCPPSMSHAQVKAIPNYTALLPGFVLGGGKCTGRRCMVQGCVPPAAAMTWSPHTGRHVEQCTSGSVPLM